MKYREEFAFLICLSAILLVAEAQGKKKTRVDDYNSYPDDYGQQDYGQQDYVVKPVDRRIPCYSCTYQEHDGHAQGTVNCNEPFNSDEVPQVMCNGSCAMVHIWVNKPTDFMLGRNCRPVCKEAVTENMYIRCCSTKLCNGFTSSIQQVKFNVCLTLLLAFVALVDVEIFS